MYCVFTFRKINIFPGFDGVVAQLENHKFPNKTTCICVAFKSHTKWSITCQSTNYLNTTDHYGYEQQLELAIDGYTDSTSYLRQQRGHLLAVSGDP